MAESSPILTANRKRNEPKVVLETGCHAPRRSTNSAAAFSQLSFQLLLKKMHRVGFTQWHALRDDEVVSGFPFPYLVLLRHLLKGAGTPYTSANIFQKYDWFLIEDDDARFIQVALKLLRVEFAYKPQLSETQFLRSGQFANQKVQLVTDAAALFLAREKHLKESEQAMVRCAAAAQHQQAATKPPLITVGDDDGMYSGLGSAPAGASRTSKPTNQKNVLSQFEKFHQLDQCYHPLLAPLLPNHPTAAPGVRPSCATSGDARNRNQPINGCAMYGGEPNGSHPASAFVDPYGSGDEQGAARGKYFLKEKERIHKFELKRQLLERKRRQLNRVVRADGLNISVPQPNTSN